jgi:hypothetical protein
MDHTYPSFIIRSSTSVKEEQLSKIKRGKKTFFSTTQITYVIIDVGHFKLNVQLNLNNSNRLVNYPYMMTSAYDGLYHEDN